MDDDMFGDNLQLVTDDLDIFFLAHELEAPFMIVSLHACIGHQMQEMQLDAINFIIGHTTANIFHHHLMCFPWKAIDQMRYDLSLRHLLANPLDCFNVEVITMGPID